MKLFNKQKFGVGFWTVYSIGFTRFLYLADFYCFNEST